MFRSAKNSKGHSHSGALALRFALTAAAIFLELNGATTAQAETSPRKAVILVSVDGLGAELLKEAPMPTVKALAETGEFAKEAVTTRPVATIPGHVSMMTGVPPEIHKSIWNENDDKLTPVDLPTLFDLTRENNLVSIFITGKAKLKKVFEKHAATETILPHSWYLGDTYGRLPSVMSEEAETALEKKPDFLFLHYALADTLGHVFGWDSWIQKSSLRRIDDSIARVLAKAKVVYGPEGFVVIVTADHGGHEASHGRTNPDGSLQDPTHDLFIPWILVGAKLSTPQETINVIDTAPSVASLLKLKVPSTWNWQGRSIVEEK